MTNERRSAPAALRNREAILKVLQDYLPERGLVLEVASGTGEHVTHFAHASGPNLEFQPSDIDAGSRASIDAWVATLGLANVRRAIALDATSDVWPIAEADVVICSNMVHIAPWEAAIGLINGAARVLSGEGVLFLYGPYRRDGRHTAPSNAAFDLTLKSQDIGWGVRDLEDVADLAMRSGFLRPDVEEMPANNLSLIFRKRA